MKVSRNWLQKYFDTPLPSTEAIAEAFTFHAFEIEEADKDVLDVKVLPNRAADCFSHRGLAKEISAILDLPLKSDPLQGPTLIPNSKVGPWNELTVTIEDPKKCLRYMGALVKNVKIGPSPEWLRKALEAVGQRSINNIVDATNYVMLDIGQPLHAFDAKKLIKKNGAYAVGVRNAKESEKITTLSGEEYTMPASVLLITDANADAAIGIAGIKGGKAAAITSSDDVRPTNQKDSFREITETTTDIIVESANFDGTTTRRAAQTLKLITDASLRFQNRPSPELCAYGMRDVLALITKIAGGEIVGVVDEYPTCPEQSRGVSVLLKQINGILGSDFSKEEAEDVFKRLGLETKVDGDIFIVTPPFERVDLVISEDLVEEVGRIIGYDKIPADELPFDSAQGKPDQARYRGIEKVKDALVAQGFTEISTQSFAKKGDIMLANPLDKNMPALRKSLDANMEEALTQAKHYAPLVLAPGEKPKLFEVGIIFPKEGERLEIKISEPASDIQKIKDEPDYIPTRYELGAYKPFSVYPFILRDISMWIPEPVQQRDTLVVLSPIVKKYAPAPEFFTPILYGSYDQYTDQKTGRISQKFSIAFQSFSRTLTDEEVNGIMQKIASALVEKGYEVR